MPRRRPQKAIVMLDSKIGRRIDMAYLTDRTRSLVSKGWPKSKWIVFCEAMIRCGYEVRFRGAANTKSKYITVCNGDWKFKVRFSDHPTAQSDDCDLVVGKPYRMTDRRNPYPTTEYAIIATIAALEP